MGVHLIPPVRCKCKSCNPKLTLATPPTKLVRDMVRLSPKANETESKPPNLTLTLTKVRLRQMVQMGMLTTLCQLYTEEHSGLKSQTKKASDRARAAGNLMGVLAVFAEEFLISKADG